MIEPDDVGSGKGKCFVGEKTIGPLVDDLMMEDRWISVDEIAACLGVKRHTFYKWIDHKNMPAHKVGRPWKFKRAEIDEWYSGVDQAGRLGVMNKMPDDRLSCFGFRTMRTGTHGSRAMMPDELRGLLSYVADADDPGKAYAQRIGIDNCLGKRSGRTRKIMARHLTELLYALDSRTTLFRSLPFFRRRDEVGQPFLAVLCSFARDPILRVTSPFFLPVSYDFDQKVCIWIRDVWSIEENSVRADAMQARSQSPTAFVLIPKRSADDLRHHMMDHKALSTTLDKLVALNTPEDIEARSAMETTRQASEIRMLRLLDEAFSDARLFQGGGEEMLRNNLRNMVLNVEDLRN